MENGSLQLSFSLTLFWLLAAEGCSAQPHLYRILPPRFKRSESLCTCISDASNWRQSDLHALFSNEKLEASRSNRANSTLPDSIYRDSNNIHLVMGRYKHLLHSGSSCMKPPKRQWKQSIGWVRCWEFLHTECGKGVLKLKCRTVVTVSLFLWSFARFLLSLACLPSGITPCSAWFLHWGYIIDETATCDCATLSNTQSLSCWLGGSTLFVSMDDFDSLTLAFAQVPWTECWRKRHLDAISRPRRQLYHYWSGPKFQGLFSGCNKQPSATMWGLIAKPFFAPNKLHFGL